MSSSKDFLQRILILISLSLYFIGVIEFKLFLFLYVSSTCIPTLILLFYIIKLGEWHIKPIRGFVSRELKVEIIGLKIKQIRKERNLTQEQLGDLVGVKKAQISKIENSLTDARFDTILKVFKALNAKINFNVELLNQNVAIR